jgi:tetratricopeptide (TPR) repeat protein
VIFAPLCAATLLCLATPPPAVSPQPAAPELLARAQSARRSGDLAAARLLYERVVRQEPDNLMAALELAETLRAMGESPAAERLLLKLVRSFPDRPEPRRALVVAYLRNGKTTEALLEARRAVALEPDNLDGHLCLGSALRASGRPADAITEFERGARQTPPDLRAMHGLALAYGELEDPRAQDAFEKVLAADPKNLAARLDFARYLWRVQDFDRGNKEIEYVLGSLPSNTRLRVEFGLSLASQGRPESRKKAVQELKRAWEEGEHEHDVAFSLGASLGQMGSFDEGVKWLREAITLDPTDLAARIDLGRLLLLQRKPQQAAAEFERATALHPDSAETQFELGGAYEAAKNLAKAEAAYREALKLQPNFGKAHYGLGALLARTGRRKEAAPHIAAYQAEFQKQQEETLRTGARRAELNLGWVKLRGGLPQEALDHFGRYPENLEALRGAAEALVQLGRDAEAIQTYERAVALAPDDAGLRYELDLEVARVRKK